MTTNRRNILDLVVAAASAPPPLVVVDSIDDFYYHLILYHGTQYCYCLIQSRSAADAASPAGVVVDVRVRARVGSDEGALVHPHHCLGYY